eukprot:tig00000117_g6354.t1
MVVIYGFRLFKYFRIKPQLYILWSTIVHAWQPILGFVVVILILFAAFALAGMIVFGFQVLEFRNFTESFDYPTWADTSRGSGVVFFMCFVVFIILIFTNVFIAIVNKRRGPFLRLYDEMYRKTKGEEQEEADTIKEHGSMSPWSNAFFSSPVAKAQSGGPSSKQTGTYDVWSVYASGRPHHMRFMFDVLSEGAEAFMQDLALSDQQTKTLSSRLRNGVIFTTLRKLFPCFGGPKPSAASDEYGQAYSEAERRIHLRSVYGQKVSLNESFPFFMASNTIEDVYKWTREILIPS